MKEFIEKLIGRLKNIDPQENMTEEQRNVLNYCIEIVNQLAEEYNNGWIPCSEKLPPQPEENPEFEGKPLELYMVAMKGEKYPFRAFWNGYNFTDGIGIVEPIAWKQIETFQNGDSE